MKKALVSVVVPTHNSARTLERCLKSIRSQVYPEIELIVVDNFSIDETHAIAMRYADAFLAAGPERSSQRNAGAASAAGSYVLFIDSDMFLDPQVVLECVNYYERRTSTHPVSLIIPEVSVGTTFWARCKALERQCYVGDESVEAARFFPLGAFLHIGGYNEAMTAGEDWDLSERMRVFGPHGRVSSFIFHDEGALSLGSLLRKKYYYGTQLRHYVHYRVSAKRSVFSVWPALFRRGAILWRHPLCAIAIYWMKSLEYVAGGLGLVRSFFLL